jgi:citrate lyase beta subunit
MQNSPSTAPQEQAPQNDVLWAVQELTWRAKGRVDAGGITLEDTWEHQVLMAFQAHCETLANALAVMSERAEKAEAERDAAKQALADRWKRLVAALREAGIEPTDDPYEDAREWLGKREQQP